MCIAIAQYSMYLTSEVALIFKDCFNNNVSNNPKVDLFNISTKLNEIQEVINNLGADMEKLKSEEKKGRETDKKSYKDIHRF